MLDVSHNNIEALPDEIRQLASLHTLSIAENAFSKFPEQILDLPHLAVLELGYLELRLYFEGYEDRLKQRSVKVLLNFSDDLLHEGWVYLQESDDEMSYDSYVLSDELREYFADIELVTRDMYFSRAYMQIEAVPIWESEKEEAELKEISRERLNLIRDTLKNTRLDISFAEYLELEANEGLNTQRDFIKFRVMFLRFLESQIEKNAKEGS